MARTIRYFDGATTKTDLTIFGNDGFIIESPGDLTTDIYGLSTCSAVFKTPVDRFDLIPPMFAFHPIFTYTNMERRRVRMADGYLEITGEFAGIPGNTTVPVYELALGVADEPIVSHPKFTSEIGGTPSGPLNGAVFLGPDGQVTFDDSIGQFAYFSISSGNEFAGIESYLAADQLTWRERFISKGRPDVSSCGFINFAEGPAPSPPSGGNWLLISVSYEQRGLCYFVTKEWRASGRRQWNSVIYNP